MFAATYIGIAIGRLPPLRIDRAGIALVGGSLMLAVGGMSVADVTAAIDFNTLALLLGMMIVVANLRLSGFFRLVNGWIATRAHHPLTLLTASDVQLGACFPRFCSTTRSAW